MKVICTTLAVLLCQILLAQQYDTVFIEKENIDADNEIYKPGNVFVYDYEIIVDGVRCKLKKNEGMMARRDFELVPEGVENIAVEKIHMIIQAVPDGQRTNGNQTQMSYLQEPIFDSMNSSGVVENDKNVWIHPVRNGFFNALETAPFPFIKKPLNVGAEWTDRMLIGQPWSDPLWGTWEGKLLLSYHYKITGKKTLKTKLGAVSCYVIESTAQSTMGETKLKSYYSEKYGFVRLEYELMNDLKVHLWLVKAETGKEFNDNRTFFMTKEYIKQ